MDIYGLNVLGGFIVERVNFLPDWTHTDVGRMLFDLNGQNYYLGAPSETYGHHGWVPIGLVTGSVQSYNINWDTDLSEGHGKVSAIHVPVRYEEEPSNVQEAINLLHTGISHLQVGDTIEPESIKDYHIDFQGSNAVTSNVIPCDNLEGYFTGTNIKIEDALNQLNEKDASDILLNTESGSFGSNLGFSATTIQAGLENIEDYLNDLTASDIPCTYEGCGCTTNVQFAIDALYNLHANLKIVDLIDVPAYNSTHRYLKSNGSTCMEWVTPWAVDILCFYPGGTTEETLQGALNSIKCSFDTIHGDINDINTPYHFSANDISYDHPDYTNVDDALDYMFMHFYHDAPGRHQPAELTPCSSIGGHSNVNTALLNLDSRLTSIEASFPCTISSDDVDYMSTQGSTLKEALDYIMNFISYIQNNCAGDCVGGFFD